jgi:putative FmdB family regulatory protein
MSSMDVPQGGWMVGGDTSLPRFSSSDDEICTNIISSPDEGALASPELVSHVYCEFANQPRKHAMPIYGYDCNSCGHAFETLVFASDTPACPSCESTDLTQQLSLIAAPAKGTDAGPTCDGAGGCGMCCPAMGD